MNDERGTSCITILRMQMEYIEWQWKLLYRVCTCVSTWRLFRWLQWCKGIAICDVRIHCQEPRHVACCPQDRNWNSKATDQKIALWICNSTSKRRCSHLSTDIFPPRWNRDRAGDAKARWKKPANRSSSILGHLSKATQLLIFNQAPFSAKSRGIWVPGGINVPSGSTSKRPQVMFSSDRLRQNLQNHETYQERSPAGTHRRQSESADEPFLEWLQWLQWSPHHNCWM